MELKEIIISSLFFWGIYSGDFILQTSFKEIELGVVEIKVNDCYTINQSKLFKDYIK